MKIQIKEDIKNKKLVHVAFKNDLTDKCQITIMLNFIGNIYMINL